MYEIWGTYTLGTEDTLHSLSFRIDMNIEEAPRQSAQFPVTAGNMRDA